MSRQHVDDQRWCTVHQIVIDVCWCRQTHGTRLVNCCPDCPLEGL